jgi:hypothetical protein
MDVFLTLVPDAGSLAPAGSHWLLATGATKTCSLKK